MSTELKVTLVCTKCGLEKLTDDFHKRKDSKSGFRNTCKACRELCHKIYRQNNREERAAYSKVYYQKNKEEIYAKVKLYYQENREDIAVRSKTYYQENREDIAVRSKIYYQENKVEIAAYDKIRYQKNKEEKKIYRQNNRVKIAAREKIYSQKNPHKMSAKSSKRRASKIRACPAWLTKDDKMTIEGLFSQSKKMYIDSGIKHHVDHIHPLNPPRIHYLEEGWFEGYYFKAGNVGEICGLEIPRNLRVITEYENCSKSNKFECYVVSDLDLNNLKSWEVL